MFKSSKILILFLFVTTSLSVYADDSKIFKDKSIALKQDFLGIHLGDFLEEVKLSISINKKYPMKYIDKSTENGITTYLFKGNHRLKGASTTMFQFSDIRLMSIVVTFEGEDAKNTYIALKRLATKKYGEMTDDIVLNGAKCYLYKDYMNIAIQYDDNAYGPDQASIGVQHAIISAAEKELQIEKKADVLGEL